jgi:Fe-S cluster biogenesis protein NfuA
VLSTVNTPTNTWQCFNSEWNAMEQGLIEGVERVLEHIRPSLGGADIRLRKVESGIVTLEYYKPLSNPSACHVDRTRTTKDIVIEIIEEELKAIIPDFEKVIINGID